MLALGAFIFSQNDLYLVRVQHLLDAAARQRARLHRAWARPSPCSSAASTCPSGRSPASWWSSPPSSSSTNRPPASIVLGFAADARARRVVGLVNGSAHPIREVHPDRRDAGRCTSRCRASVSCSATDPRRLHQRRRRRARSPTKWARSRSPSSCSCSWSSALEFLLRRSRWGWRLRAVGSDEESARRIGVKINRTVVLAYVATSLLTSLGRDHADGADRRRRPAAGRRATR